MDTIEPKNQERRAPESPLFTENESDARDVLDSIGYPEVDKTVGEIRTALESEVVDGSGGHCEPCMTAGTGTGHFIDPGDKLSAEQSSRGIDILISDHIYILDLREFHAPLGTGITGSVIRSGIAESGM